MCSTQDIRLALHKPDLFRKANKSEKNHNWIIKFSCHPSHLRHGYNNELTGTLKESSYILYRLHNIYRRYIDS